MRQAKIVCTLGPASDRFETIKEMIAAGMDVARLNFSHGDHESHRGVFEKVRRAAEELGKPVAILGDLCGPKIRVGEIEGGSVRVATGGSFRFTDSDQPGTADSVGTNYPALAEDLKPGDSLLVDDGLLHFVVESIAGADVLCRVEAGGLLKSRKGMNIPHAVLSTPTLTEKDKADIEFGRDLGVDYFALSFVRSADDVAEAQRLAGDIPLIAKIEKPEAIENLSAIGDTADGLMVARGDLAIEIGPEKVPMLQKRMIREMNRRAKPVITATQMLESMVSNPIPTRAEVSDVANAVIDGTDAVMLSAESAAGEYPVESVKTLVRIIESVEASQRADLECCPLPRSQAPDFRSAIAHAAALAAIDLKLAAVAVYSETGRSVARVSSYRPYTAIVAFTRHRRILPRLALHWGVRPVFGAWVQRTDEAVYQAERVLLEQQLALPGDHIAVTFGRDDGIDVGTSIMRLWVIRETD